jgi:hypothetical protein
MARFIGSIYDYEKFLGPRIRNIINTLAKNERDSRNGICEFCGKETELQSAHKHGKGCKEIIWHVLEQYRNAPYIDVYIEKCETEILLLHKPINEFFHFLCVDCHRKYDSDKGIIQNTTNVANTTFNNAVSIDNDIIFHSNINDDRVNSELNKVQRRIDGWFTKKTQINSKILYTFLKIYEENNGIVKFEELKYKSGISKFDGNFNQMKNFGEKNHGKIFEQQGENIYLWEKVEEMNTPPAEAGGIG